MGKIEGEEGKFVKMEYRENRWKGEGERRKEEEKSRKRNRVYKGKPR